MSYMVMERCQAYAIVLDDEGRFLKVANLGYEVGQRTDFIVGENDLQIGENDLQTGESGLQTGERERVSARGQISPSSAARRRKRLLTFAAAAAACICLMAAGSYEFVFKAIGTINVSINPQVEISVNKLDRVIEVEGENEDGERLIEGYRAFGKKAQIVADELADRAIAMGYLSENGRVTITVDSDDDEWKNRTQEAIIREVSLHIGESYSVGSSDDQVSVEIGGQGTAGGGDGSYGDSGYSDSAYGDSSYGQAGGESSASQQPYAPQQQEPDAPQEPAAPQTPAEPVQPPKQPVTGESDSNYDDGGSTDYEGNGNYGGSNYDEGGDSAYDDDDE